MLIVTLPAAESIFMMRALWPVNPTAVGKVKGMPPAPAVASTKRLPDPSDKVCVVVAFR